MLFLLPVEFLIKKKILIFLFYRLTWFILLNAYKASDSILALRKLFSVHGGYFQALATNVNERMNEICFVSQNNIYSNKISEK